jgi:glycosyltransferase involved in cell wall biosynthesis
MKIGVVHRSNVADVRSLSGFPHFMARSLARHVGEVVYLGPDRSLLTKTIETAGKAINRTTKMILGRHISFDHNRLLSKRLSRVFDSRLAQASCDVIFAPNASVEIACLTTDLPIIYSTDLNWADIVDYYPGCSSMFGFARAAADRIEGGAIAKSAALIYPSAWAAKTAVEHYGANSSKVHCIPFGANFEEADIPPRAAALRHSLEKGIGLLWVGVDWERKGGAIAHDCLLQLLRHGVDAHLTVCGCLPPQRYQHPKLAVIPFLSKNDPVQRRKLSQLFLGANFFLFPTMAEAFGIVLCEASAHGLPSLARDTGGVSGAITEGENGYLFPPDATGERYAEKILTVIQNPNTYHSLVQTSRKAYEDRLNWDAWGRSAELIFKAAVKAKRV